MVADIDWGLYARVLPIAKAAGADPYDAAILASAASLHPENWRDWDSVEVWRLGARWLATWTRDAVVWPDSPEWV